ncbi:MAG TPA: FG-GAP-like repeat-containing protein [Terriglobia bacterium]|nr:FG-GAP-like repeat-containing protein [Terriglobia bacterium]
MQASQSPLHYSGVLVVILGLWSFLTPTASAQSYIFGRADFPTSNPPTAVLTADFNGDGRLDLAVVTSPTACEGVCGPGSVAILLGKPDGTFGPPTDFPVGNSPSAIAIGDFNGDGRLDLAVVNQGDNTVSVLLGNGDGTFQPHVDYATGAQFGSGEISSPGAVAVADFNGDGKPDLAVANSLDGTVSILIAKGDGTFAPHFDYPANGAFSLVTGDFNGDGKVDIVTVSSVNNATTFSVLLGNGDGSFKGPVSYELGVIPFGVAAGDLNRDGKLDLVVSGGGVILVLLGNGNGTFQSPVSYSTDSGSGLPVIVDLNGDGKLDVLLPGVAVFLGNGDGTLQPPVTYSFGGGDLVVGDFNGDGLLDLAGIESSGVTVLLGNGNGTFSNRTDYSVAGATDQARSVVIGDFNNDGKLDVAVAAGGLEVAVFLGNGDGTFQAPLTFNSGRDAFGLVVGDFNLDGKLDLAVIQSADQTLVIYLGNGDGTFKAGASYATGQGLGVAVADLNGDGKPDLVLVTNPINSPPAPSVSVLLGNGDGTFQNPISQTLTTHPQGMAIGDLNGDGKLDLVLANGPDVGTLSLFFGNGDGTFQPHVDITSAGFGVVAGDFNNDGKLDLAAPCSVGFALCVLLGNGDGTFQSPIVNSRAQFGIAGDFNGDGKLDLSTGVSIELGNGDGTFQPPVGTALVNAASGLVTGVAAADLNGDDGLDLVTADQGVGTVSVLLNVPTLALYPTLLNFTGQGVGTTSPQAALQVSNSGSMKVDISNIAVSGSFAHTTTCGSSLTVGTACDVNLTFSPAGPGPVAGSVTFTDTAPGSPQVIGLSGTGVNGPFASLSPLTVDFGGQPLGTKSAPLTVTLANTGNASLVITGVSATGDFTAANTCNGSVGAGASCSISVTFKPSMAGFRAGNLTIADNSGNGKQVVGLVGTGTVPGVTLSPSALSFPHQQVGTTSAPQGVALTNSGAAPLNITAMTASGDFTVASGTNCSTTSALAAGDSCTIKVSFTPTASGNRIGTLTVTDNAPGSPQTVSLTGLGAAPIVQLSPTSFTFPSQVLGTTSTPLIVTVNNEGGSPVSAPLTITSLTTSGDFAVSSSGGSCVTDNQYLPSQTCTVAVTFTPTAAGKRTGSLIVTDDAPDSPQTVALSGSGADFSIAVPSGSSTSATVTAGQSASYSLNVVPAGGFNSTVTLACSGAPPAATCSILPASVTPSASAAAPVTVSVGTAMRSMLTPRPRGELRGPGDLRGLPLTAWWITLAIVAMLVSFRLRDRRRVWAVAARLAIVLATMVVLWTACGGGGSMNSSGTPAGTYTLTITGTSTSGSVTLKHSTSLTLKVN